MFWQFLIVSGIAIVLIRLGELSVWVTVLSLSLKVVVLLALGVGLLFLWRRFSA